MGYLNVFELLRELPGRLQQPRTNLVALGGLTLHPQPRESPVVHVCEKLHWHAVDQYNQFPLQRCHSY